MTFVEHLGARDVHPSDRRARFRSAGDWRDRTAADLLNQNAFDIPDSIAAVDRYRRVTWEELAERSHAVAGALVDQGLRPGDFVGIQLPNRIEFAEAYYGAVLAGLRVVTMMTIYRETDLAFMLGKVDARALITIDTFAGRDHATMGAGLKDELPELDIVLVVGDAVPGTVSVDDAVTDSTPLDPRKTWRRALDPDELSRVAFTSGTSGTPKGVMHTHNTDLVSPAWMVRLLELDRHSHVLVGSPVAHVAGLTFGLLQSALCGSTLVLQESWTSSEAVDLIIRENVQVMISSRIFATELFDAPNATREGLANLKYFVAGGSSIPPTLVQRGHEEFDVAVLRSLGMTEAPIHVVNRPLDPLAKKFERDGRVIDGAEARVADLEDRTKTVTAGEVGEFATRGPHVFLGYLSEPGLTADALDADGWYYSGDLVTQDEDGYFQHRGRIKDIVNRGSIKISAAEVEEVLLRHPAVRATAVVPAPDERLGERTCAFVVLEEGVELDLPGVVEHFEDMRITRQKWPERLELIDVLPTNAAGKIDKAVLRTILADRVAAGSVHAS